MPTLGSLLSGSQPAFWPALQAATAGTLPGVIVEAPHELAGRFRIGAPLPQGEAGGLTLGGAFGGGSVYRPTPAPSLSGMQAIQPSDGPPPEKKFLGMKRNQWAATLAAVADSIRAHQGQPSNVLGGLMQSLDQEADRNLAREQLDAKLAADREERLRPKLEQVGNTIGMFDPSALAFNPIFTAPSPPEQYASALGHAPGSPEYVAAVRDYRLGAWSDPAMANRRELEGVRHGYRDQLQDSRYGHMSGLQEDRQEHSNAQLGRRLDVTRRGQDIGSADRRRGQDVARENSIRSNDTRLRTARSAPRAPGSVSSEAVAIGPDGKRYVVRNGQWVPAR